MTSSDVPASSAAAPAELPFIAAMVPLFARLLEDVHPRTVVPAAAGPATAEVRLAFVFEPIRLAELPVEGAAGHAEATGTPDVGGSFAESALTGQPTDTDAFRLTVLALQAAGAGSAITLVAGLTARIYGPACRFPPNRGLVHLEMVDTTGCGHPATAVGEPVLPALKSAICQGLTAAFIGACALPAFGLRIVRVHARPAPWYLFPQSDLNPRKFRQTTHRKLSPIRLAEWWGQVLKLVEQIGALGFGRCFHALPDVMTMRLRRTLPAKMGIGFACSTPGDSTTTDATWASNWFGGPEDAGSQPLQERLGPDDALANATIAADRAPPLKQAINSVLAGGDSVLFVMALQSSQSEGQPHGGSQALVRPLGVEDLSSLGVLPHFTPVSSPLAGDFSSVEACEAASDRFWRQVSGLLDHQSDQSDPPLGPMCLLATSNVRLTFRREAAEAASADSRAQPISTLTVRKKPRTA